MMFSTFKRIGYLDTSRSDNGELWQSTLTMAFVGGVAHGQKIDPSFLIRTLPAAYRHPGLADRIDE